MIYVNCYLEFSLINSNDSFCYYDLKNNSSYLYFYLLLLILLLLLLLRLLILLRLLFLVNYYSLCFNPVDNSVDLFWCVYLGYFYYFYNDDIYDLSYCNSCFIFINYSYDTYIVYTYWLTEVCLLFELYLLFEIFILFGLYLLFGLYYLVYC